jgi:type III secretion system FlhB-like substrate exporter
MAGSGLAKHFRLATPEPAIVRIEADLAELIAQIEPEHGVPVRQSVGLNFGSELATGFGNWPVEKSIPEAVWQAAVDIFAFDALIQNPDRRWQNPNLLIKGDVVLVYDHEVAFSFLVDLLPSATPWKLGDQRYLEDHVFFTKLRSKPIDLNGFIESLGDLTDDRIERIGSEAPPEWNNGTLLRIEAHLRLMREHAEEFAEEIRRRLI